MNRKIAVLILLLSLISIGIYLGSLQGFLSGLYMLLILFGALWVISLLVRDSSIIDSFWGMGYIAIAWYYFYLVGAGPRGILLCTLVSIWGIRLSLYIFLRNFGHGEDFRYQEFRRQGGKHYWWISYFRVFLLQGLLCWIISSLYLPVISSQESLTLLDFAGIAIWAVGFYFEAVSDWQMSHFRKNPANKGQVMDRGLWKYSRHPNYFGDALLWWGYFMFVIPSGNYQFVFCPLLMTFLLMRVSGVVLLEEKLKESKAKYKEYIKNTPAFFPFKM